MRDQAHARRIESMIDHEDESFAYREDRDVAMQIHIEEQK